MLKAAFFKCSGIIVSRSSPFHLPGIEGQLLHQGDGVEPVDLVVAAVQARAGQAGLTNFQRAQNQDGKD